MALFVYCRFRQLHLFIACILPRISIQIPEGGILVAFSKSKHCLWPLILPTPGLPPLPLPHHLLEGWYREVITLQKNTVAGYSFQTRWAQWSRWQTTCPSWPHPGSGCHCTSPHSNLPPSGSIWSKEQAGQDSGLAEKMGPMWRARYKGWIFPIYLLAWLPARVGEKAISINTILGGCLETSFTIALSLS